MGQYELQMRDAWFFMFVVGLTVFTMTACINEMELRGDSMHRFKRTARDWRNFAIFVFAFAVWLALMIGGAWLLSEHERNSHLMAQPYDFERENVTMHELREMELREDSAVDSVKPTLIERRWWEDAPLPITDCDYT